MKDYTISKPIISIILIADNSGKVIEKSIKSILNQTFKDFELIIYDNCSKDNTASKIDLFLMKQIDNRIKVKHLLCPQTLSEIKNKAIQDADGKYITFLNAEDIIGNYYLECLMEPLKSSFTQFYQALSLTGFSVLTENLLRIMHLCITSLCVGTRRK